MFVQQPREARGGTQFPGRRALPARAAERLPKIILGRRGGSLCALQQKQLALDAQQLRNQPTFFSALDLFERLLDNCKSLRDFAGIPQGTCQCSPELHVAKGPPTSRNSPKASRNSCNPILRSPRLMASAP